MVIRRFTSIFEWVAQKFDNDFTIELINVDDGSFWRHAPNRDDITLMLSLLGMTL